MSKKLKKGREAKKPKAAKPAVQPTASFLHPQPGKVPPAKGREK